MIVSQLRDKKARREQITIQNFVIDTINQSINQSIKSSASYVLRPYFFCFFFVVVVFC